MGGISLPKDCVAEEKIRTIGEVHASVISGLVLLRLPKRRFSTVGTRCQQSILLSPFRETSNPSRGRDNPAPFALMYASFRVQQRKSLCTFPAPPWRRVPSVRLEKKNGGRETHNRNCSAPLRHPPPTSRPSGRLLFRDCSQHTCLRWSAAKRESPRTFAYPEKNESSSPAPVLLGEDALPSRFCRHHAVQIDAPQMHLIRRKSQSRGLEAGIRNVH
jgi:hypothetical protein